MHGLGFEGEAVFPGKKLQRWSLRMDALVVALRHVLDRTESLCGNPPYESLSLAKDLK